MQRTRCILLGVSAAALLHPALSARAEASFSGLGSLAGAQPGSVATGLSADGSVVVGGCPAAATCSEAWRWTAAGGMQGLGFLPGETESGAGAVSGDGDVVFGTSGTLFRWTASGMVDEGSGLPAFDLLQVSAASSDGGVAVGGFLSTSTLQGGVYRWTPGTGVDVMETFTIPQIVSYGALSADGTVIAGSEGLPDDPLAFVLTGSGKTFLPELPLAGCQCGTEATAISSDGLTVVGGSQEKAFRWTAAGGIHDLGLLPDTLGGEAQGVSADGSVIVGSLASATGGFGPLFVWSAAAGLRDLGAVLEDAGVDLTGWTLTGTVGVSDDGRIVVGNGSNPSGDQEAWRAVLPEPPPTVPGLAPWAPGPLALLLVLAACLTPGRRLRAP